MDISLLSIIFYYLTPNQSLRSHFTTIKMTRSKHVETHLHDVVDGADQQVGQLQLLAAGVPVAPLQHSRHSTGR